MGVVEQSMDMSEGGRMNMAESDGMEHGHG